MKSFEAQRQQEQVEQIPRLWNRTYILTLLTVMAVSITMTLFMPLLPIYIKSIGGDTAMTGLVVSIYTFAALVFRPVFAVIIDRIGRKSVLMSGLVLIGVTCIGYLSVADMQVLLFLRVLHGIGYSAASNAAATIIADSVPMKRRSQGIGYFGFVMAASLALGPAIGLTIFHSASLKSSFGFALGLAIVGLLASIFISVGQDKVNKRDTTKNAKGLLQNLLSGYELSALPASSVMFIVAIAYGGIVTYLATYARTMGINQISFYFIVYAIILLVTRIVVDIVTKGRNVKILIVPGILSMAIALILLAYSQTMNGLIGAAILYAIGFGSVQPTLNAMIIGLCHPKRRGAANATFYSAMDLGIGLGALIWGLISEGAGYSVIYQYSSILMFLAVVVYTGVSWIKGKEV